MRPVQVLDMQADLLARLDTPHSLLVAAWSYQMGAVFYNSTEGITKERADTDGANAIAVLATATRAAHTYFVTPDMTDLVEWSSARLDDTDRFRRDEVPTGAGFLWFDKPLRISDVRGGTCNITAVLWHPIQHEGRAVIGITLLNDRHRNPDEYSLLRFLGTDGHPRDLARIDFTFGPWELVAMEYMVDGMEIGPSEYTEDDLEAYQLTRLKVESEGDIPIGAISITNVRRIMHACWLMLGQTLVDVRQEDADRARMKRMRRVGLPRRVSVIDLRRVEHKAGVGESKIEWSYRTLVRGYWRWQPVSEHHPLAEPDGAGGWVARIWVSEYIRGPEDKPLHIPDRVYALRR